MASLTEVDVRDYHAVETLNYRIHMGILKLVDKRELQRHTDARTCRVICTSLNQS